MCVKTFHESMEFSARCTHFGAPHRLFQSVVMLEAQLSHSLVDVTHQRSVVSRSNHTLRTWNLLNCRQLRMEAGLAESLGVRGLSRQCYQFHESIPQVGEEAIHTVSHHLRTLVDLSGRFQRTQEWGATAA